MGQVVDAVREAFAAMGRGDVERFREVVRDHLAPDCEVREGSIEVRGPEAILPIWTGWMTAFPEATFELGPVIGSEEGFVFEERFSGTHLGTLVLPDGGEVPATGRPVELRSAFVVRTDGGKITSWHSYYDQMALAQQLGLVPAPSPS